MKRALRRLLRLVLGFLCLLLLLIAVEVVAGWRCDLQGSVPSPLPQPEARKAAVADIKGYSRPEDDAYLSLPEWYIVWSYQEKADFQQSSLPSRFPYFAAVRQYWGNYCCISRLTRGKYGSNSGEHVMLVVIGTSFSAEYILKGLYEKTIGRLSEWTSGHQFTEEDQYAYNVAREYAEFVHIRPFYEFRFARHVGGLWAENPLWGAHEFRKVERRAFLTIDFAIEAFYCWLIEKATHLTYGHEPSDTYAWVDQVDDAALAQVRMMKSVGPRAYVVDIPRYQEFTTVASMLAQRGVRFVEIAGNSQITLSVLVPESWSYPGSDAQRFYSMPVLTHSGSQRVVLGCRVSALDQVLRVLPTSTAVIEHIYDY